MSDGQNRCLFSGRNGNTQITEYAGRIYRESRPREQQQRRSVNPSPPKQKLGHELYGVSTEYGVHIKKKKKKESDP